jgi:dolichyl-phosphate-mannose-protein mannosyltransferase
VLVVLALRLPFLNQAFQGDDIYYLYGAEHAQIDPLHPNHARYPFLGQIVDMRGHPHPPLDAWFLAGLLALFKNVDEVHYHAAYILFSLIAGLSALALARRFSPHALAATLLFLVTPAFVVNGNSLESDLPFIAFWLLSTALFVSAVDRRSVPLLAASCTAMLLASLTAYQTVILFPILLLYGRKWRASWLAALAIPAVLGAWQLYERLSTGALPAGVLAGYMQSYGLQVFSQKLKNAAALTGHLAWLVFPALWIPGLLTLPFAIGAAFIDPHPLFWASIAIGIGILFWCARQWRDFLCQWVLIFYIGALIIFFAGSARYLLPIVLPIAILSTRRVKPKWLYAAIACEAALSLALAVVNYQHWDGYRRAANVLGKDLENKRAWINGEWGLRFYFESEGALPLMQGQAVHPGELIVSSSLAYPLPFTTGGGMLAPVVERTITSRIPLRIVALNGKSAYSTTSWGLRPFDISTAPIDRVRAETVIERKPSLSMLPMNAPEAEQQIVSGIYALENGQWRWMSRKALLILKVPRAAAALSVRFYIPDASPARRIEAIVNQQRAGEATYPQPGTYVLATQLMQLQGDVATVEINVDKTFSPPGDQRQLGIILTEVGLQ